MVLPPTSAIAMARGLAPTSAMVLTTESVAVSITLTSSDDKFAT